MHRSGSRAQYSPTGASSTFPVKYGRKIATLLHTDVESRDVMGCANKPGTPCAQLILQHVMRFQVSQTLQRERQSWQRTRPSQGGTAFEPRSTWFFPLIISLRFHAKFQPHSRPPPYVLVRNIPEHTKRVKAATTCDFGKVALVSPA